MFKQKSTAAAVLLSFILPVVSLAQGTAPARAIYTAPKAEIDKIKDEGMNRSQVMQMLSHLTDVIGPRLTGSPQMKRSNEWTRDTMAKWGMQNAKLEAWGPFGRGWTLKSFSAEVVEPQTYPFHAFPSAWSPSTKGAVTGEVVAVTINNEEDFAKYRGQLKGKIVLLGSPRELKPDFGGMAERLTDAQLAELAAAPAAAAGAGVDFSSPQMQPRIARYMLGLKAFNFVAEEGAAVVVRNSSTGSGGTIFVQEADVAQPLPANFTELFLFTNTTRLAAQHKAAESKIVPQIVAATEDFNRLVRLLNLGVKPRLSVNIQAQYNDDDPMAYNTVAEIPGTDPTLKSELVMLGGHLDSWHAGTGATDNAAGVAAAMEAARIIIQSGLKPRRTIRVALWSGEEQGLYGSTYYVKKHFGHVENGPNFLGIVPPGAGAPKFVKGPDYDKLSAYYNLDNGTGKIRGIYAQGNTAAKPYFEAWLAPFVDAGAKTVTLADTGGTDHLPFDMLGLPGFQFIQDEIEYDTRTHHSNQDVFDRLVADDMKQAATVLAAFVYQTAMMDEKLPRKMFKY